MMKYSFAGLIKDVDANGDGKVTREELSNAVEKVKASGIGAAPGMSFLLYILLLLLFIFIYFDSFIFIFCCRLVAGCNPAVV